MSDHYDRHEDAYVRATIARSLQAERAARSRARGLHLSMTLRDPTAIAAASALFSAGARVGEKKREVIESALIRYAEATGVLGHGARPTDP